jgi:hypothetical protein
VIASVRGDAPVVSRSTTTNVTQTGDVHKQVEELGCDRQGGFPMHDFTRNCGATACR